MTKKFFLFGAAFFSFLLLTLYACRNDLEGIKNSQNEHRQSKFVSFQKFLRITKFNKRDILQNYNVSAKSSLDDFIIDTIKIRQTLSNGNITAFSFLVYPKNYDEETETKDIFYNLAYVKKDNVWKKSIFKFTTEKGWLYLANLNPRTPFNGTIQLIYPSTTTARTYICGYTATPYFYCWAGHTDPNDGDCGNCWNFHISYIFCNDDSGSGGSGGDDGSSGGCGDGIGGSGFDANLPTLDTNDSECNNAKLIYTNTAVKSRYELLKNHTRDSHETGYGFKTIITNGISTTQTIPLNPDSNPNRMKTVITSTSYGFNHTHIEKDGDSLAVKILSPADINAFISYLHNAKNNNIPFSKLFAGMLSEDGSPTSYNIYQVMYNGDGNDLPIEYDSIQVKNFTKEYLKRAQLNVNDDKSIDHDNLQKLFFKTLGDMGLTNIVLFKIKDNIIRKITFDSQGKPTETICPN